VLGHVTDPAAPGGLALKEMPEPVPGDSEVVIDVRAYSVNRGELNLLEMRPDGWPPGQDVAGLVAAPARAGGPATGTRVVGLADQGGWSERVAVPLHRVAALPDAASFAEAAGLPVAGLTALRALGVDGPVLGRSVLVTGASGGVGSVAVQLAVVAGARVTALVSGPHRVETVARLGPDEVVTSLDEVGPFELVLEGVGGDVLVDAVHRLAPGGTVVGYGLSGGRPSSLAFRDFRAAPLGRLVGFFVYGTDELTFGKDLGFLARLVAEGRLKTLAAPPLDWSRTLEGIDALRRRDAVGKTVFSRRPEES
jgi:NADPH:quinone reductase